MAKVDVYTTDYCGYCRAAKALLDSKNIPYNEIKVDGDDEKRKWLTEVTGRFTVPQIFINDQPVGGFDDLSDLDRAGKLDSMLAG